MSDVSRGHIIERATEEIPKHINLEIFFLSRKSFPVGRPFLLSRPLLFSMSETRHPPPPASHPLTLPASILVGNMVLWLTPGFSLGQASDALSFSLGEASRDVTLSISDVVSRLDIIGHKWWSPGLPLSMW